MDVVTPAETTAAITAKETTRKVAVELIGTFFLVFTVGASLYSGSPLAPLAIGAALMVMVYAGGHVSGAHFNPAVTMAVLVRGRIDARDAVGYWIAQLVAGLIAAVIVRAIVTPAAAVVPAGQALGPAIVAELLFTFALTYVVLNVATSKDHPTNSFYGLAIGFTIFVGAVAVGGLSGAVFNPAVALGASILGLITWTNFWIYLVVELVAGAIAGLVFRAINPTDK